jgi:hypothetical protein
MPEKTDSDSLSAKQLLEMLPKIIEEARKPVIDPAEEARKAEEKRQWRATREAAAQRKIEAEAMCAHSEIYRGVKSFHIVWLRNSDGVWRGVCTRCQKVFSPETLSRSEYNRWVDNTLDVSTAAAAPVSPRARAAKQAELAKNWK